MNTYALDFQNALPDVGEFSFCGIARHDEMRGDVGAFVARFGECAMIQFAVCGERHFLHGDERGGEHVVGQ